MASEVRKQHGIEMKERIRKTALTLFDEHGFDNVSVEDIAQAVGCSVGNIYHYFRSKEELSLQVTEFVDTNYEQLLRNYLAEGSARPAAEKLLDFVGRSLEISVKDEMLYKAFTQSLRHPEQGTLRVSEQRVWYQVLDTLIGECQEEGSISRQYPTETVIHQFIILHRGVLMEWRICEQSFDLVEEGKKIARLLLKGLAAPEQ